MDFLTEVDKLVQLIECPIFTCKGPASGRPGVQWGEATLQGGRQGGGRGAATPGALWNIGNAGLGAQSGLRGPDGAGLGHMVPGRGACLWASG